jgi:hypothetical protein
MIAVWSPMYIALFNIVSRRHKAAHGWLKALGFDPLKAHRINGYEFTEYGRLPHV